MISHMDLFETLGVHYALWVWPPPAVLERGGNGMNYCYRPDPDNVSMVENDLQM